MSLNQIPQIFNRKLLRTHRNRAADNFAEHDFLFKEMAENICSRLEYIKRDFPAILDLGAHTGIVAQKLSVRDDIQTIIQCDISESLINKASGVRLVADEELFPFAENSFDLVVSAGSLHWTNDLAGTLIQIKNSLKPDGLFIAIIFGPQTLKELRASFEQAEMEGRGGVSPRISPFVDVQSAGSLLQRAGFTLPVVDSEIVNVEYSHPLKLMHEIRGMGEANSLKDAEKNFTPCSTIMATVDNYMRNFSNEHGRVNASFEFITMTGWKAHSSQQKPLARGSGTMPFSQAI